MSYKVKVVLPEMKGPYNAVQIFEMDASGQVKKCSKAFGNETVWEVDGKAAQDSWKKMYGSVEPRKLVQERFRESIGAAEHLAKQKKFRVEESPCDSGEMPVGIPKGTVIFDEYTDVNDGRFMRVGLQLGDAPIANPSSLVISEYKTDGLQKVLLSVITIDIDGSESMLEPAGYKGMIGNIVGAWQYLLGEFCGYKK
jgi:hypothetical protein